MISNPLPLKIEPFILARQGAKFSGCIDIAQFPRLSALLVDHLGQVGVNLEVGQENGGPVYIKGHVTASLKLQCQRCGEAMDYAINVDLKLSPVLTEAQAVHVPNEYDAWVTHNAPVSVLELIEEELLLGLPMIAKHAPLDCPQTALV